MLFNDVDHSTSLLDTLMVFSDDQMRVRDSFKTTIIVNPCLYTPSMASFQLVLSKFTLVCKCLGHDKSLSLSYFNC